MKRFYSLFQATILLIIVINTLLLFLYWEAYFNLDIKNKVILLAIFIVINFLLIIVLVDNFFHNPLKKLDYTIKSFYLWNLKDSEIKFKETLNPHLNSALKFFAQTLKTLKNIKSDFIHGKAIKWEVEIWKEIQWKMLEKILIEVPDLDIIVKSKPAWEIGWDSYDIIKQEDQYFIYVWDATWHGVGAWFIMIMVNALISWFSKIFKNWANILAKTNEILKPRIKANLLMTLLLVRWDHKNKRFFMTWAWHEYLMIYKHKQNKTFKVKSGWVALWMMKDCSKILKEKELSFEENDIVVLYSDWITEAINRPSKDWSEEMFGTDRLIEAITKSSNWEAKTAKSVFNNITIELSKFMWYNHTQLDDITLWVIHYTPKDFDPSSDKTKDIDKKHITEWNWN